MALCFEQADGFVFNVLFDSGSALIEKLWGRQREKGGVSNGISVAKLSVADNLDNFWF